MCVLILCTQVNIMFLMLHWVYIYIYTGQAKKLAWPQRDQTRDPTLNRPGQGRRKQHEAAGAAI
jgi:hypothetical protein